jgi:hypothetical protein
VATPRICARCARSASVPARAYACLRCDNLSSYEERHRHGVWGLGFRDCTGRRQAVHTLVGGCGRGRGVHAPSSGPPAVSTLATTPSVGRGNAACWPAFRLVPTRGKLMERVERSVSGSGAVVRRRLLAHRDGERDGRRHSERDGEGDGESNTVRETVRETQ